MTKPMVSRIEPERPKEVDNSWENMFTPPDRLDDLLLLDVILANRFYETGVDRLEMTSQKRVKDGWVTMEVGFDREHPELDEFVVTLVNGKGIELRRERYTREEVDARFEFLSLAKGGVVVTPAGEDVQQTPEALEARRVEVQARLEELCAATRPAVPRR